MGAAGLLLLSTGPQLGMFPAAFVLYGGGYGFGWSMASVGSALLAATILPIARSRDVPESASG